MSNHAFLAPSSAGLTVHCAAAPSMQAPFPDDDTPAAIEGTAAHWVMARMIDSAEPVPVGSLTSDGVAVTQEMVEGAQLVCDTLRERLGSGNWRGVYVEETIHGTDLHPEHNGGTPDIYYFDSTAKRVTLCIWDYKFGHGFVDEYENWQLINYASLILEKHDYRNLANLDVEMTVIQPRCYAGAGPVRTWKIAANALVLYWNRLRVAFDDATKPNPQAVPGPWCNNHYCRARHACPALQRSAYFAAEEAMKGMTCQLSPEALGVELRILEEAKAVLDARIGGLTEQALSLMQSGKNVPHYIVAYTRPRLRWTRGDGEILAMGEMMGIPLAKPPEPITPTQARKLGFDMFSETPPGTPKLVRDTALQFRRVFG